MTILYVVAAVLVLGLAGWIFWTKLGGLLAANRVLQANNNKLRGERNRLQAALTAAHNRENDRKNAENKKLVESGDVTGLAANLAATVSGVPKTPGK